MKFQELPRRASSADGRILLKKRRKRRPEANLWGSILAKIQASCILFVFSTVEIPIMGTNKWAVKNDMNVRHNSTTKKFTWIILGNEAHMDPMDWYMLMFMVNS